MADEEKAKASSGGGKGLMIVLLILVILLIGAVGGGGYYLYSQGFFEKDGQTKDSKPKVEKKETGEDLPVNLKQSLKIWF